MSSIDDIVPDELCTLTPRLDRAFKAVGCDPQCHCCEKSISVGQQFKLAFIKRPQHTYWNKDSTDEMLCYHCTPEKLLAREKEQRDAAFARRRSGGYTRKHR